MGAITVCRLDDSSNFSYHTRHPIGSVLELRTYDRVRYPDRTSLPGDTCPLRGREVIAEVSTPF